MDLKLIFRFIALIILTYLLTGCSSKEYFEPQKTKSLSGVEMKYLNAKIKSFNKDGATLGNHKIITKDGVSTFELKDGFKFLNDINSTIIAADLNGTLLLRDSNISEKTFKFDTNIVAASLKQNFIAIVFQDNSLGLYDTQTQSLKFREYKTFSILNDVKIANPIFVDDLILYPTLDGNIVIASLKEQKIVKTINIDPSNQIHNVIFLGTAKDTMIAATPNKLVAIGDGLFAIKDYSINDVMIKDGFIYIATLDGNIIKFNLLLEQKASKKFKFAKLLNLFAGENIYALESQKYLIQLDTNLTNSTVYDLSFDSSSKVFAKNNVLYFDENYIKLK